MSTDEYSGRGDCWLHTIAITGSFPSRYWRRRPKLSRGYCKYGISQRPSQRHCATFGHVAHLGDRVQASAVKLILSLGRFPIRNCSHRPSQPCNRRLSIKSVWTMDHCQLIYGDALFDAAMGLEWWNGPHWLCDDDDDNDDNCWGSADGRIHGAPPLVEKSAQRRRKHCTLGVVRWS